MKMAGDALDVGRCIRPPYHQITSQLCHVQYELGYEYLDDKKLRVNGKGKGGSTKVITLANADPPGFWRVCSCASSSPTRSGIKVPDALGR